MAEERTSSNTLDLEQAPALLHFGLLETVESNAESGWIILVVTNAGRAAVARFRKRGT